MSRIEKKKRIFMVCSVLQQFVVTCLSICGVLSTYSNLLYKIRVLFISHQTDFVRCVVIQLASLPTDGAVTVCSRLRTLLGNQIWIILITGRHLWIEQSFKYVCVRLSVSTYVSVCVLLVNAVYITQTHTHTQVRARTRSPTH